MMAYAARSGCVEVISKLERTAIRRSLHRLVRPATFIAESFPVDRLDPKDRASEAASDRTTSSLHSLLSKSAPPV
jgi:hypothetical protein